jgi:hypothetical protein
VTPNAPDCPDTVAVQGDNVWVSLRSSGKLLRFKGNQRTYEVLDLDPTCPAAEALCYAVHGGEVRY